MEANINDQLTRRSNESPKIRIPMERKVLEKFEKWRRGNL